jgi:myo-inositol-1-phosphate synthase
MEKIKVAIIGTGNCAKSLVEGVQFYTDEKNAESTGMMKNDIGGYKAKDIEFVCGFDIDERKIGLPFSKALKEKPNSAWDIVKNIDCQALVYEAPVIDGYALLMDAYPESNRFLVSEELRNSTEMNRTEWSEKKSRQWKDKIISKLKEHKVDILINYLPVGSQKATEFWAEICLETGISFEKEYLLQRHFSYHLLSKEFLHL